jgi:hypothetical protein
MQKQLRALIRVKLRCVARSYRVAPVGFLL